MLPIKGTPAPGEPLHKINIAEVIADLKDNWDYYLISGHGFSIPNDYQKVPERTYMIFNAPAGCVARGGLLPYTDVLVNERPDFLRNFLRQHVRAIDRLHQVANKKPVLAEDADFLLRTLAPSERAELQTCAFPPEFYGADFKPRTNTLCRMGPAFSGKTIYGPGESYPNTMIYFKNKPEPATIWLGVYELPVSPAAYAVVDAGATATGAKMEKVAGQVKSGVLKPGVDGLQPFRDIFDKGVFTSAVGNVRTDLMGTNIELSKVIEELPLVPAGKSRFLFITSCRGLHARADKPVANAARLATLMRQASVGTENTDVAESVEKAKAAAEEYYAAAADPAAAAAVAEPAAATAIGGDGTNTA